jgi:hypothetical protein
LNEAFFAASTAKQFFTFVTRMVGLTLQQKAQCVIWMAQLDGPAAVQRKIRSTYGISPSSRQMPSKQTLKNWLKVYQERGTSARKQRQNTR